LPLAVLLSGVGGCTWDQFHLFTPPPAPPPPAESLTLRGDKLEADKSPQDNDDAAKLAGGHELYRKEDYAAAEKVFHFIAEKSKVQAPVAEEARFYEAECLRHESNYPKAADTYNRQLTDFPSGIHREQAVQHMFEIANFWLDDTRKEMEEEKEKKDGKRWVVWPEFVHWDKTKPLLDEEGRALEKLEQVRYNDMTGPTADKALFLAGSVKLYRQDYKEAEYYYSQLVEMHKNSPFYQQAMELAIISKQLSTGGPEYDMRKLAEARQLVDTALRTCPDLATQKSDFLNRQLFSINMQQAAKDFGVAEFYKRTGHPCSAFFCYEVVRRRYPGTKYAELATARQQEIRAKLEKSGSPPPDAAPPPGKLPSGQGPVPPPPNTPENPETMPAPRSLPPELAGNH
jgi:outer membrane protein assembly factor BamD (BamD/ComL family)